MDLRFFPGALDDVLNGEGVQAELERHADAVVEAAQGSHGTSRMRFRTRKGRGRRGAFAQAIMSGDGAIAVEFGTSRTPPLSPLRSALRRRR